MEQKDNGFNWQGINRFNKGIILSLIGFCLLFLRDVIDVTFMRTVLSIPGYLLALAGFVVAGSGMAHHWRDMYAKNDKGKRNKAD